MSDTETAYEFEQTDEATPAPVSNARLVPRIAIQAFCVNDATTDTMQKATTDRRLSRAHVAVQSGGIQAAISYYSNAPTPNLVIVESQADAAQLLGEIENLASVCDEGTNVIVVGHKNDVILYRELMRCGVSDYVIAPISVLQIIDSIGAIYEDPEKGLSGSAIAFIGAKGGVGSSTIAHNISWAIAELIGEDVVITDLDLAFGTVGLDFNQDPPQGIADALNSPDRLDEVLLDRLLSKCTEKLNLFAAPSTLDREYDVDQESLQSIVDLLRTTAPVISLDLPHMWTGWTRSTLFDADQVVITAAPDLANLRNAKNMFDILRAQRPNDRPPYLVLNQMAVPKRPEISLRDFSDALSAEPVLTIQFDPQLFGTAANNGQMIAELPSGAKVAGGFADLAKLITGRGVAKKAHKARFPGLKLDLFRKKG
ncbi:MAG: AAA family ATPase [Rhizobiales bacterium]|nr:AAA family ATPase [Hyphomicrobiales bacterium]